MMKNVSLKFAAWVNGNLETVYVGRRTKQGLPLPARRYVGKNARWGLLHQDSDGKLFFVQHKE